MKRKVKKRLLSYILKDFCLYPAWRCGVAVNQEGKYKRFDIF